MARSVLEAQLEEATRAFVSKILGILRNASLAEVAAVEVGGGAAERPTRRDASASPTFVRRRGPRALQGQTRAAEGLEDKVMAMLGESESPMAARAMADKLGVPLDALAKPLKELRDAGRILKRGEKRASKYLLA